MVNQNGGLTDERCSSRDDKDQACDNEVSLQMRRRLYYAVAAGSEKKIRRRRDSSPKTRVFKAVLF